MALGTLAVNEPLTHAIKTFEQNVIFLVEQKTSKLRTTVTERSPGGTVAHSFRVTAPRTGALQAKANQGVNAGKRQATVYEDTVYNDRVAVPAAKYTADSYEWDDAMRMMMDPQSLLTRQMASQLGRGIDDIIIAAFHATAIDTAGTAGLVFPAANTFGTGADLTLANVLDLNERMLAADIDPDEEKFLVVCPSAVTAMLNETKLTSSDYVNFKALAGNGNVDNILGFRWIVSNRLAAGGAGGRKYAMAYSRDSMGLLITKNPFVEAGKDPSTQFSTSVMAAMELGAVRIQDDKVWRIDIAA